MNELVFLNNSDEPVTTSLKVAEYFKRKHKNVVKAIEKLASECNGLTFEPVKMFDKSSYTDEKGEQRPMYFMNRDGFSLLVMGFNNTPEVLKFKLDYIDAFNKMEDALKELVITRGVVRQSSVLTFKDLMDAVHDEVIPAARKNGSTTADKIFYINFNKLINKNAGIKVGNRDGLPTTQLIMIDQMQNIAAAKIRADSHKGKTHKEIYSGAKQVIEGYAQVALVAERFLLK